MPEFLLIFVSERKNVHRISYSVNKIKSASGRKRGTKMKTKFVKAFAVMAIVLVVALTLTACRVTTKSITVNGAKQVYAGEFDLADYSIVVATSDGNMRTEPLTAQNLANVTVEQLQKAGEYDISVVYDGVTTTFTLTVVNRTFDGLAFADKTVTYDGTAQSIEVANLPQGAMVTYSPSNTYTNAGIYPVTATVSAPDFDTVKLTATLTIEKATYDMSQVVFADKSVTYDGTTHSLEATNLPDGVTVMYIGNNQTNVGKYNVVAIFSGDAVNYNPIANKTATLTIVQSAAQGVTFADAVVAYDGTAHSLEVVGNLPQGIAVIYENNNQTNAGVYTVTAKFVGTNPNYEQLPDMTATLTINKRDLTIEFVGATTIVYDGNAHKSLTARATNLCGNDTVDINISYSGDMVEAGTYTATATVNDVNYQLTGNNTCTVTITRATHKVTFRQSGQPDKVYDVLDLDDFTEPIPQVVSVAGYMVVWEEKDLTRVTEDIVVNAIITPVEYSITYVLDGGTNPDEAPDSYTIESATLTLPTPTKRGYAFDGWFAEDTFGNKIEQIAIGSMGDVTLHAKWTVITYSLTVDLDGGALKGDLPSQFTVNDLPLTLPHCYQKDYTFTGWELGNGEIIFELNTAANVTIKAVFAYGTEGLEYILLSDNEYAVSRYTGTESDVVIPCTWQNVAVTVINAIAFAYYRSTSISLPNGIKEIGENAFYSCTGLTNITIPDSVTSIGEGAFFGCSELTTVYWNAVNCTKAGSFNSEIFQYCSKLTTVVIGENVQNIPIYAFKNCTELKSITIPNSVTSIGEGAFSGCSGLTEITLPFVGGSVETSFDTTHYPFGYIFGTDSYYDGVATEQIYLDASILDETKSIFYIPKLLKSVTITDGDLPYGAFSRCSNLTNITLDSGVTSIEALAFFDCTGLTNVIIGDEVAAIGYYAFTNCSKLTSISIPNSVTSIEGYVFEGCSKLTNVTIGDRLTSIGEEAFACTPLTSITVSDKNPKYHSTGNCLIETATKTLILGCKNSTIPSDGSVTHIGNGAFGNCAGLTSISIPNNVISIGDYAFYGCADLTNITIPDSVTLIGESAFSYCRELTGIIIPNNVISIGNDAFSGCSKLTSISLGSGITSIGSFAFSSCSKLTSISIPDSVTSIGDCAFLNCSALTNVTIGGKVTLIGEKAFSDCSALTSFTVSDENSKYHSTGNCLIETATKTLIWGCKNSTIPSDGSVTKISNYAFYGCTGLISITIPDNFTSIGDFAFLGCSGLKNITIPDSVTFIGECAFQGCSALTSMIIPNKVTSIGDGTFYNCTSLTKIDIPDSVTSIGVNAFFNCSLASITIPSSVTSIENSAFQSCANLTRITISTSVTSIGEFAINSERDFQKTQQKTPNNIENSLQMIA